MKRHVTQAMVFGKDSVPRAVPAFNSPFGDHLEQEIRTDLGQGHIVHLIERHKIVTGPAGQRAAELPVAAQAVARI